jgi:hypothetical protein
MSRLFLSHVIQRLAFAFNVPNHDGLCTAGFVASCSCASRSAAARMACALRQPKRVRLRAGVVRLLPFLFETRLLMISPL